MPLPDGPLNAPTRLAALRRSQLLDSPTEPNFDRLTQLASRMVNAPVCLVSLVSDTRQFFKSAHNLAGPAADARETPLTHSFCQHVVTSGEPLVINDAPKDPRVKNNLAIRDLGVMAYLGAPIRDMDGEVLGSFCLIDGQPREWQPDEVAAINDFARLVETEISLRTHLIENQAALARQKALLEGSSLCAIVTTPHGKIEVISAGAQYLLGYSSDELIQRANLTDLLDPTEMAARATALRAVLGREIPADFSIFAYPPNLNQTGQLEWNLISKEQTKVPTLLSITPIKSPGNILDGYLALVQDLTAFKRSEAALQATRIQLEKTFSSMSEGLAVLDATGAIVDCNDAALRILGLTRDQMMARSSLDPDWGCIHEDGRPFPGEDHPAMMTLRTGQPQREKIMGVHHVDGSFVWIEINSELIGNPIDSDRQVVASFRDVTERRRAETALKQSEQRFRTLAEHAPVGIFQTDPKGSCLFINEPWTEVAGLSAEEAMGDGWSAALHPDDRAEVFAAWNELCDQRKPFHREFRFLHRDGTIVWVTCKAVAVRDHDHDIIGYIGTVSNINDQKEIELNLARSRDQALETSRLKSEFLSMISHEIRTPMNAVIGMADMLAKTDINPEQADMLQTIENGAENLMTIINEILDFSRIEAGQLQLESAEFVLPDVIRDTVKLLAHRAEEKGIAIAGHVPPELERIVVGDAGRIRQVLVNLVGNAIKFTDSGHVTITAHTESLSDTEIDLRLEVQDSGIGISPSYQDTLFEPFTQVEGGNTRRYGGTGLGLAICKKLIVAMDGTIGFESKPGAGTTFEIKLTLPALPVESDRSERLTSTTVGDPTSMPPFASRPLRLLLVEDNLVNQKVALTILRSLSHTVEVAQHGEACLARLATEDFDVILMDCQMPVMDGFEATRRIRSAKLGIRNPDIPIIALTAHAKEEDRLRCLEAGMDDYVSKPIRRNALMRALAKIG